MHTIIKIPFDKCIVEKERRGAASAPDEIEKELKGLSNVNFVEIKEKNDFEKMHNEIENVAGNEYKSGNFVIGLGGDHSVTYGLMKAFSKRFKNSGFICFDAHLDCEDDFLPPTHEDLLKAAVKEKLFKKIFVAGVRNYTKKQEEYAAINFSWDSAEVPIETIKQHINDEFLNEVDNIYISIDIDVFDPEFAPGTGYPEKNGLKPDEILPIIKDLMKSGKVKGADLVEVSPPKDINNTTSRLAAAILIGFLGNNAEKAFV
jgi:agmatinase